MGHLFIGGLFSLLYLHKVWLANRSVAWMLGLNVLLLTLLSVSFSGRFPTPDNALDVYYQLAILPSVWGLYALLVFLLLMPLTLIPGMRYLLIVLCAAMAGTLAVTVLVDDFIYEIYNYHINWFFIEAYLADEGGEFFDISLKTYLTFNFAALLVLLCELAFMWLVVKKITLRKKYPFAGWAFGASVFTLVLTANLTHSWAYAKNYAPITSMDAHIPFYFPLHSRSLAENSWLTSLTGTEDGAKEVAQANIFYPKNEMQCRQTEAQQPNVIMVVLESWRGDMFDAEVAPNTHKLATESLWFKDHYSSGSVTTRGIFALMYGLAPTYMDNVVANNGAGGPVLLNELKKRDYQFGIYPSGDITRMKLADSSFAPVKPFIEHGEGKNTIEKDFDVLAKMTNMIETSTKPFFGFMFFNSTHHQYYYPEKFTKFTPYKTPSIIDFKQGKDPKPYLNHYKNSLLFVDSLVGELIDSLKKADKWQDTILIVTSDHGEEFADTRPTRFGHGSNYTRYQTHVPLVIHWPGKAAQSFEHRTASIDVAPTLLQEALACENKMTDYASGESLFNLTSRPVQIMSSYYNYAFVTPAGSFVQNPIGLLESKDNQDNSAPELSLSPKLAFLALQKMKWFYTQAEAAEPAQ
ncbi:MAG: sulfatase-like hydrolase/transferase [Bermanella sp.]